MRGDSPPRREEGQGVARPLASCADGGSGYRNDADNADNLIAHCLTARHGMRIDAETETFVTHTLRADGFDASEDGTGRGTPLVSVFDPIQITSRTNRSVPTLGLCHTLPAQGTAPIAFTCKDSGADCGDMAPTLRAMGHDVSHANADGQVAVAFNWQSGGDCRGLDPAEVTMAVQREQPPALLNSAGVRRLTPVECERLQGIPDNHTLVPHRGKLMADGPRYKLVGNSWAVPVARWIFARVAFMDALSRRREAA